MSNDPKREVNVRHSLSIRKKLCPNCLHELEPYSTISGWLTPEEYICTNCEYAGILFVEEKE